VKTLEQQQKIALGRVWRFYRFNKAEIARSTGVSVGTVYQWFNRGRISATAAILIEDATDGEITKEEMRPDVKEWFGV
jgi:DNA-binding transcriptional regulator YdaS (Cro superfamily)